MNMFACKAPLEMLKRTPIRVLHIVLKNTEKIKQK